MHKPSSAPLAAGLCLALSAALGTPAFGAEGTHVGGADASHMELKSADGTIVCSAYGTPANAPPAAAGCPVGTYTEQLFDANWLVVGQRTVTIDTPPPASRTHVGVSNASHMELKGADGAIACSAYGTPANAPPVAAGCPEGTFTEQLFDVNWVVIGQRSVTVGLRVPPRVPRGMSGDSPRHAPRSAS